MIIARQTEFFDDERFIQFFCDYQMFVDIFGHFFGGNFVIFRQFSVSKPLPIFCPNVNCQIVDVFVGVNLLENFHTFRADSAFVSDDDEMKILGMRVMGNHASSTSQAIALMIALDAGIDQLAELIFPHPSVPEGIQECARMLRGKSIVKPEVFNLDLRCYRVDAEGRVENLYH